MDQLLLGSLLILSLILLPPRVVPAVADRLGRRRRRTARRERSGGLAHDVSPSMVPGEVVAIIGPDGAAGLLAVRGLARAVAEAPRLVVLDEPFAGLDAAEREDVASHIRRLRAAGVWVVVIDHVLDDLVAVADRVVAIEDASFGQPQETLVAERL